jgi:uncharacterized membrane protein YagU involved in acid resistance
MSTSSQNPGNASSIKEASLDASLQTCCAGMVAGFTATGPMTVFMDALHPLTPRRVRRPIAPCLITNRALDDVGLRETLPAAARNRLSMLAHFSYGSMAGAPYALLEEHVPLRPAIKGALYGLAVWAAGYCAWLPLTGLHPPPQRDPASRTARIIGAHLVWGATLGLVTALLRDGQAKRRPG